MTDQLDTEVRRLDRELAGEQVRIALSRERLRQFRALPQDEQDEIRSAYAAAVHAYRMGFVPDSEVIGLAAKWPT